MEIWIWRIAAGTFLILCCILLRDRQKVKKQLSRTSVILDEILEGNLDRRILDHTSALTSDVCYKINQIVLRQKEQKIAQSRSERAYRQLATSLSHDLRTPLASLGGYLEALEGGMVPDGEEHLFLHTAMKKAGELKDYVDILFDWMKLESGESEYHFAPLDICELTRETAAAWIFLFEEDGIHMDVCIPEEEKIVPVDREAWIRIIENLLQNIRKHSGANQCGLELCFTGEEIELCISDNGKGIAPGQEDQIFTRLYMGDASRSVGGSGLGLSIVQELVQGHGGKIEVRSAPRVETCFHVSLPYKSNKRT